MSALTVDTPEAEAPIAPVHDLWMFGVARRVRGQLAEHEKTQHDAAAALGLSQSAVNRRLKGHLAFTIVELGILAEWMGVPITDLLPRETKVLAGVNGQDGALSSRCSTGSPELPMITAA